MTAIRLPVLIIGARRGVAAIQVFIANADLNMNALLLCQANASENETPVGEDNATWAKGLNTANSNNFTTSGVRLMASPVGQQ